MSPNLATLPLELLYHTCAPSVAEYLDSLIAGDAPSPDPAQTAPNPLTPLLQTCHALPNATLTVLSAALGIPASGAPLRR